MVVIKNIPFKKKTKPGLGESKEYKKGDMMVVTRSQDRKYLGKLVRPVMSGDYLQPRLGFADRHLQMITYPPLEKSRWIPRNDETGTPVYMEVDPRRQESLRWFRKLSKVLRLQDHFLNPDMMAHPKKKKSEIPYVDLRDDNYRVNNLKGKDIPHTKSDTSVDEDHPCTHLSYLTNAVSFGNETGDEEFFDDKKRFMIPKIEPQEYPNG